MPVYDDTGSNTKTAEGNVIDGLMDRAKEQAREILLRQRLREEEIRTMTHTRNPTFGEYRVTKLLRAIVNHFSSRETAYELRKELRAMIFDPAAESVAEYFQRYLATHQRCRVKGVKMKLELEELAETLPEIVQTRAGGHSKGTFPLRGTIRKYIQDHPGADAHDLGDEIRRSV